MLNAVVVDDEPLARERLRSLLQRAAVDVQVVGESASGREAVPLIHDQGPDLVFLDIQMPGLDGFDVTDLLAPPRPHIVFVTAFDEYALRAFEVHALDYLTKPVNMERLNGALQRIATMVARQIPDEGVNRLAAARQNEPLRRLTLQVGHRLRIVEPSEVQYFEARDKLVFAQLANGKQHVTSFTLQTLEDRLDPVQFLRIHRAFLVNVKAIRELVPWFSGTFHLYLNDGSQLPVSRRRARSVKDLLKG